MIFPKNDDFGGLIVRRDEFEPDADFSKYVNVYSANLGCNDSEPPIIGLRFKELPFCVRLDLQLATQLRDGLNVLLASDVSGDDDTEEMDFNIGGDIPRTD